MVSVSMRNLAGILILWAATLTTAQAELYLELGFETGGDELVLTDSGETLNAGGGFKLAAGIQNHLNDTGTTSMRLVLGYLFDSLDASNGSADIDSVTFDALLLLDSGPHRLGFGPTLHLAPRYQDNVDGFAAVDIEFDDAVGITVQYGYRLGPGFEIGLRLTDIEYENASTRLDAGSFGVYLSNGF